jgi:hypothetical protein
LKCNLNKTKIVVRVFKKGGKLKIGERWYENDHRIEVVDEINYLGVTFESSGGWNKQKLKVRAKGNQNLVATDKCLARAPDIKIKTLENVYEMLSESRTMYGIEICGLEGGWNEIDKICSRFCKIILGMPRSVANNLAELELGRDSRRGKVLRTIVKYWLRLLRMDSLEIVRACYDWQINNLKADGWARKLNEELGKIGLAYIWQSQFEINVNICNKIREKCNDIERQNIFSSVKVNISLLFYCAMKLEWGKESYIDKCTRKKRMGIIWWKAGIWKLRGIRRGFQSGRCPLCLGEEDAKHKIKMPRDEEVEKRICK